MQTFLKISVDNYNNYYAYLGKTAENCTILTQEVDLSLFKGIDMWQRFDSINEMIYFILTKYEDNIYEIGFGEVKKGSKGDIDQETQFEENTIGGNFTISEGFRFFRYYSSRK